MKQLWISVSLLAVIFVATLANAHYLEGFSLGLKDILAQAEMVAEQEDWAVAESLTQEALQKWESHDMYLYTMLRHSDADQVHTGFHEVMEFIRCQEGGEYSAANSRLIAQIELISQMEQFSLKNLL